MFTPSSITARNIGGLILILGLAGCAAATQEAQDLGLPVTFSAPTYASIAGKSPGGTVTLEEVVAGGNTFGQGTLRFQGRTYSFKLAGGVTGGGAASKTTASGEVYNLNSISDFPGVYAQSDKAGFVQSGPEDLWMGNANGVVMHLHGQQSGFSLSIGHQQVVVEMM